MKHQGLLAFIPLLFALHGNTALADPESWSNACNYPDAIDSSLDPQVANLLKAEVMLVNRADIQDMGNGYWHLTNDGPFTHDRATPPQTLCTDSLFYNQYTSDVSHGRSGFLIGPDLVATAPHGGFYLGDFVVVYGFSGGLLNQGCSFNTTGNIPAANVYQPKSGGTYINPELGARLAAEPDKPEGPPDELTPREVEVLGLLALGYVNPEIAEKLVLSVRTVETHRANIQRKTGLSTRAELIAYAIDNELVER